MALPWNNWYHSSSESSQRFSPPFTSLSVHCSLWIEHLPFCKFATFWPLTHDERVREIFRINTFLSGEGTQSTSVKFYKGFILNFRYPPVVYLNPLWKGPSWLMPMCRWAMNSSPSSVLAVSCLNPCRWTTSLLNTPEGTRVWYFTLQSETSFPLAESDLNHRCLEGQDDTNIALKVASLWQEMIPSAEKVTKTYFNHLQSVSNDSLKTP